MAKRWTEVEVYVALTLLTFFVLKDVWMFDSNDEAHVAI